MKTSLSLDGILKVFVVRDLGARDFSIDALRGLAIIGMVLVNHSPPTGDVYAPLVHSPWVDWTLADTIFPIFLFLVGVSISYSTKKSAIVRGRAQYARVFRRMALLVLISIALVNFPYYEIDTLKVHGTLFRIAYCYMFVSFLNYWLVYRLQLGIVLGVLLLQWWLLTHFQVPDSGAGVFTVAGNASAYIDLQVFGEFSQRLTLSGPVSQGLLPSLSAVVTTLIGTIAGRLLGQIDCAKAKTNSMFGFGLVLFVLGNLWSITYPVSKPLWTGSYVLLMSGLSLQLLALTNWLSNWEYPRRLMQPLYIAGVNALFFYLFAQLLQRLLVYGRVSNPDGTSRRFHYLIYENWVEPWASGKVGALIYNLCFLAVCYLVVTALYRRKIFFKL